MSRLQIRMFGPYFSSFLVHSYGYEPAKELKSVLKHPNFRFGPYSSYMVFPLIARTLYVHDRDRIASVYPASF
jgi:hypothetical protein